MFVILNSKFKTSILPSNPNILSNKHENELENRLLLLDSFLHELAHKNYTSVIFGPYLLSFIPYPRIDIWDLLTLTVPVRVLFGSYILELKSRPHCNISWRHRIKLRYLMIARSTPSVSSNTSPKIERKPYFSFKCEKCMSIFFVSSTTTLKHT